jgi:hypothetical protein
LKVIDFKDEAKKKNGSIEEVRRNFEKDFDKESILGIIAPNKTEAICFERNDIEALITELSSGKASLANLAEQLNLTVYQVSLVLQYLLKTNQIDGELTYSTFISKVALRKTLLEKAKVRKRNHRLKVRNRHP